MDLGEETFSGWSWDLEPQPQGNRLVGLGLQGLQGMDSLEPDAWRGTG